MRDKLVCGLRSEVIQRRLLVEENLTLKKAQELALGMETAAKNICELQGTRSAAEWRLERDVCRVQHEVTNDCCMCGKQNQKPAQCPPIQECQVSQLWQSWPYKESLQTTEGDHPLLKGGRHKGTLSGQPKGELRTMSFLMFCTPLELRLANLWKCGLNARWKTTVYGG